MSQNEHSRALRLAERVTQCAVSQLEQQIDDSRLILSIDPDLPHALLTARVTLTTLRRLPGHLILQRGDLATQVVDNLAAAVQAIDPDRPLEVTDAYLRPAVRLHVGPTAPRGTIRVAPERFGAHLANHWRIALSLSQPAHPLGAIYAAALGAGEVFKRWARVLPERRLLPRYLRFCPVSLSTDLQAAPDLPDEIQLNLALVGLGAIGTGTALVLSAIEATGQILLVDLERYAPENRGTYSLGGDWEARNRPWKVEVAAAVLGRYDLALHREGIEEVPSLIDAGELAWPSIVLSGLDSIDARHATQRMWPDHLIDGATGDTALGLHYVRGDEGPCLMCFLPAHRDLRSSIDYLVDATGLPADLLTRGETILSPNHLNGLDDERRQQLLPHVGKPVCGLAEGLGLTKLQSPGYRPAVPFVSLQASCLCVGRLFAIEMEMVNPPNFVQYDALLGPKRAAIDNHRVLSSCYCQSHYRTIQRVRAGRSEARASRKG